MSKWLLASLSWCSSQAQCNSNPMDKCRQWKCSSSKWCSNKCSNSKWCSNTCSQWECSNKCNQWECSKCSHKSSSWWTQRSSAISMAVQIQDNTSVAPVTGVSSMAVKGSSAQTTRLSFACRGRENMRQKWRCALSAKIAQGHALSKCGWFLSPSYLYLAS